MRLIPNKVRCHRAALMACLQFVEQGTSPHPGPARVLIFVSVAEHYVEILVDDGIAQHIDNTPSGSRSSTTSWSGYATRRSSRGFGVRGAHQRHSDRRLPATRDQNELPDSLIILDKP